MNSDLSTNYFQRPDRKSKPVINDILNKQCLRKLFPTSYACASYFKQAMRVNGATSQDNGDVIVTTPRQSRHV